MKTKIQITTALGSVLFELDKEDNSIKKTLEAAVKAGADLTDAYLWGAYLRGADLRDADLTGADLRGADLWDAYLGGADLTDAYLRGADLTGAYLRGADLTDANLGGADLGGANLGGADLRGADLRDADLGGAKFADLAIAMTRILPEGDLIGYKKAYDTKTGNKTIIKLRIPSDAKRSSAFGRKCRAEYADVLEMDGATQARSEHDSGFVYEVGKRVTPDKWDEDFTQECSNGIHFFITRLEAENY